MASDPVEMPRGVRLIASITEELQQLVSSSLRVKARIDIEALMNSVIQAIAAEIPVTCMALLLKPDPGMAWVVVRDVAHPKMASHIDHFISELLRPGEAPTTGLTQRVLASNGALFKPSMTYADFLAFVSSETRAYLSGNPYPMDIKRVTFIMVPMRSGAAIVGTLSIFDWRGGDDLCEDDLAWMQSVADRVGLLVDSAQLRNRAIDRIERLISISQAAFAITSSQDLRLTLDLILKRLIESLHVEAAQVLLADESGGAYRVVASLGFSSPTTGEYKLPAPPRAAHPAAPEPMDYIHRRVASREGFKYYRASPLVLRDRVIGSLEVFSRGMPEPDPEWTAFLEAMASQTAIAVDNAMMHAALQREVPVAANRSTRRLDLSPRERQILHLVIEGASNRQVAEKLYLSQSTVKLYVRKLLDKSGASNRTELASKAVQESWV